MSERLPLRTYLYFAAQSINLTAAVMSVAMAAIVGALLAPEPAMATLPYGFQFLFVMLVTYPASWFMSRFGRKAGFMLGNLFLTAAGVLGFAGIQLEIFWLLVAAHAALGTYVAFANFNRFAAADNLPVKLKARAISLVVAGGVLAAFLGPLIAENVRSVKGYHDFAMSYASFVILAVIAMVIAGLLPRSGESATSSTPRGSSHANRSKLMELLKNRQVILAIAISSLGYGVMNLLMVQASLHMASMHTSFADVSQAIQWHVIAMFAPSFFTGKLVRLWKNHTVLYLGIVLLMLTCATNIWHQNYMTTTAGLILLGLGWNFTYVGGGALLASTTGEHPQAMKAQGINDVCISVMATLGAFLPSLLMVWAGWSGTNVGCLVICAIALIAAIYLLSVPEKKSLVLEIS